MVIFDIKTVYKEDLSSKENIKNLKKVLRENEKEIENLQIKVAKRNKKEEKIKLDVENASGGYKTKDSFFKTKNDTSGCIDANGITILL